VASFECGGAQVNLGLEGRVALVTGGTQGIGLACVERFLKEGSQVVMCARDERRIAEVVERLRPLGPIVGLSADVRDAQACARAVEAAEKHFGRLDALVNNAGTAAAKPFETVTDEAWAQDLELKVLAAVRMTRLALPLFRARGGGRVVNVTNIGAKAPAARSMPSSVSRAAGLALTKAMSKELAADKVGVNAVCIGSIVSGQHDARAAARGISTEAYYAELGRDVPLGRVGLADEAAAVICFLAAPISAYVTGTAVNIDGGAAATL
jgi:3-oxoacyl-[acyl-carrier protein] reductase